jgi:hypothetical protein
MMWQLKTGQENPTPTPTTTTKKEHMFVWWKCARRARGKNSNQPKKVSSKS